MGGRGDTRLLDVQFGEAGEVGRSDQWSSLSLYLVPPATPSLFPSEISSPTHEIPTLLPVILGIWLPLEQR